MNKINAKLGISRLCLMSFIFLCSVFMSENVFSGDKWQRDNIKITYDKDLHSIFFDVIFYDFWVDDKPGDINFAHLKNCSFACSQTGDRYTPLMKSETSLQVSMKKMEIKMKGKLRRQKIQFFNCVDPVNGSYWHDDKDQKVVVKSKVEMQRVGRWGKTHTISRLIIVWHLPDDLLLPVKSIKVSGIWQSALLAPEQFTEIHSFDYIKSSSKTMKSKPSKFNLELSNKVKVSGGTDAITVTGAKPGENIKVFNASGAEIKSVVANDDVVNIKLTKNKIYNVKVGQTGCKVAL